MARRHKKNSKLNKKSTSFNPARFFSRFIIWLVASLVIIATSLYLFGYLSLKGPSEYMASIYVNKLTQSQTGQKIVELYLTDQEISALSNLKGGI